jgi:hypothetical protein
MGGAILIWTLSQNILMGLHLEQDDHLGVLKNAYLM